MDLSSFGIACITIGIFIHMTDNKCSDSSVHCHVSCLFSVVTLSFTFVTSLSDTRENPRPEQRSFV